MNNHSNETYSKMAQKLNLTSFFDFFFSNVGDKLKFVAEISMICTILCTVLTFLVAIFGSWGFILTISSTFLMFFGCALWSMLFYAFASLVSDIHAIRENQRVNAEKRPDEDILPEL